MKRASSIPEVLVVFGTRPEILKLAPVVNALQERGVPTATCLVRQHGALADQALGAFRLAPTYDVPMSFSDQALFASRKNILRRLLSLARSGWGFVRLLAILKRRPALVMVQGDTSTVFLTAFLAFHFKIPIAHVEAGLRTYDKYRPFPEEMNRQLVARLAEVHFAPTEHAAENLRREDIAADKIHLVGNTAIDALRIIRERFHDAGERARVEARVAHATGLTAGQPFILVTAHRRESFEKGLDEIFRSLRTLAEKFPHYRIILPAHPNPHVAQAIQKVLIDARGVRVVSPLDYELFVWLMTQAKLIITDSGGIQEEASFLGTPVIIAREVTERAEVVAAGAAVLAGTTHDAIVAAATTILSDRSVYQAMAVPRTLFGDGHAAARIATVVKDFLGVTKQKEAHVA